MLLTLRVCAISERAPAVGPVLARSRNADGIAIISWRTKGCGSCPWRSCFAVRAKTSRRHWIFGGHSSFAAMLCPIPWAGQATLDRQLADIDISSPQGYALSRQSHRSKSDTTSLGSRRALAWWVRHPPRENLMPEVVCTSGSFRATSSCFAMALINFKARSASLTSSSCLRHPVLELPYVCRL